MLLRLLELSELSNDSLYCDVVMLECYEWWVCGAISWFCPCPMFLSSSSSKFDAHVKFLGTVNSGMLSVGL